MTAEQREQDVEAVREAIEWRMTADSVRIVLGLIAAAREQAGRKALVEAAAEVRHTREHGLRPGENSAPYSESFEEWLLARADAIGGANQRCGWPDCPGRSRSEPMHEIESGPELHDECKRIARGDQPDACQHCGGFAWEPATPMLDGSPVRMCGRCKRIARLRDQPQGEPKHDCAPDCEERDECSEIGLGHSQCGHCVRHGQPRHHCGCGR